MPAALQVTLDFLEDIRFNNNRVWFQDNRKRYDAAQANFNQLIEAIMQQFGEVEDLGRTTVKECVYRINRDVRFSKDKTPYKFHMGAVIGNGGRKSTGRSYYIQIQPGESMVAGGVYMPEAEQLKHIRAATASDNGKRLRAIINHADFKRYFGAMQGEQLKSAPKGYSSDHAAIDLLRHKQFLAMHMMNDADVLSDDLVTHVVAVCKALKPFEAYFNDILNGS